MKDKNVIVHVKNEQEWDIIKKECSPNSTMFRLSWKDRSYQEEEIGIWIKDSSHCDLNFFKKDYPKIPIISFEEYQTGYIVGKWYKFSAIGPKYYAKFSKIYMSTLDNKGFWFEERISDGSYSKRSDWWAESHKPTLVTDLSEIQEFLPNGHEDKEGVEYKFPEKWCIRQNASQKACDWYNKQKGCNTAYLEGNYKYITSANGFSDSIFEGYTEITAEQFEKYVLNVPEVKMWDAGTYAVFVTGNYGTYTKNNNLLPKGEIRKITKSSLTYIEIESSIYWVFKSNCQWCATLEEAEKFSKTLTKKEEVKEFKKGEYIVTLKVNPIGTVCAKNNYCFEVAENNYYLNVKKTLSSDNSDGNTALTFNKNNDLKDWRYATKEEAAEYERIGKPYDVTTLSLKELTKDEYLFISYSDSPNKYIVIGDAEYTTKNCISIKMSYYCKSNKFSTGTIQIRKATQEEINWLDACIKADKFVEKPVTNQNLCIGGTDIAYPFKEGSNTIYLMGSNMHPSNEGFQSLRYYNNLPNSISVKVRTKKPETQTVSKRVKLNFQINKSTLKIKVRNDK